MHVRVAFKNKKKVHERDMWIVTVFDTPADIVRYSKRAIEEMQKVLFTKKAKNKELIVRKILEVVELTYSQITIDEHKGQDRNQV